MFKKKVSTAAQVAKTVAQKTAQVADAAKKSTEK
jgi:hypothetical protein